MRTISTAQDRALLSPLRTDHMRVRIDSDGVGTFVDLTDLEGVDWVRSATIRGGVDNPMSTATISLWREWENLSLSTLMSGSKINASSTVVDIAREIKIETATVAGDAEPVAADWTLVFHGYVDDIDFGGDKSNMRLVCRDLGAELADTFIESVAVYGTSGGQAVETAMQNILNANITSAPTLYVPTSPSWNILEYKQVKEPVYNAIRKLANQIGWDLRYKWRSGTSQYELTLYEPDRTSPSVDRSFDSDEYYSITQAAISRKNIRNRIKITYGATAATRTTYTAENAASKSKYGVRYMEIAESSSSNIDSAGEAQTMADAILSDLKEPTLSHSVEMPYFFAVEIGDYYTFEANGVHYDSNQSLAVVGFSHNLTKGKCRTTLQTRGVPSAGVNRWLEIEGRPGVGPATDDLSDSAASSVTANVGPASIIVTYDDPRTMTPPIKDWAYTECHLSTSSGFTPSSSTLRARGKTTRFEIANLIAGTLYYIKLVIIDESNNVATTSTQISKAAGYVGPGDVNPNSALVALNQNSEFGVWTPPLTQAADPPDHWHAGHLSVSGETADFVIDNTMWGSGEDVYFNTSIQQTGDTSIRLDGTAPDASKGYPAIISEFFPVNAEKLYAAQCNFRCADIDDFVYVRIEFFEDDKSTFEDWLALTWSPQAVDTFYQVEQFLRTTADTRWARIIAAAPGTSALPLDGLMYVDRLRLVESMLSLAVYVGSAQSITALTRTQVQYDTVEDDRGSDWDTTNDRLLVPEKGTYQVSATVATNLSDGEYIDLQLFVDGVLAKSGPRTWNNTGSSQTLFTTLDIAAIDFDKGEDVDIRVYHNGAASRNIIAGAANSFLSIRRISL